MIRNISLSKLVASERNVRRAADPQADLELKADIEARGLLQNLVVTASRKPRGFFCVEAGGRRLRALKALVEEGKVGPAHEVCCLVLDRRAEAVEASLAENFQRLAMNPADECLAFRRLVEEGSDVAAIARRFGLSARFVEGRLRLASLAPVVFDALGAGEIGLDAAKAYGTTPDQERQAHVFEQMKSAWGGHNPDSIRRLMTQATASGTDRRARFVGEEAYVAAGGRIERDLFADAAETRWLDVPLLEQLASEKLEALAEAAAAGAGLGWARPTLDSWISSRHLEGLERVPVQREPLTEAESAELEALEGEADGLAAILEDEAADDAALAEAERRMREVEARMEALGDRPFRVDPELRPNVGAFLMLDAQGRPCLDDGFYAERPGADEGEGEAESCAAAAGAGDGPGPDDDPHKAKGLSQRLVDELAMQRRDILAAHLVASPELALDLAIFLMVDGSGYSSERMGSTLAARPPCEPAGDFRTPDARASLALAKAREALDRGWTGLRGRPARFDAFRALPRPQREAWLCHALASTLEASLNLPGQHACAFHDHLGSLLGIDVAAWWRPTGLNFFDRVPKWVALDALRQVGGEALAERHAKAKKAELSQACERLFAGEPVAGAEVGRAALAWIPEPMLFAAGAAPEAPGGGAGEAAGGEEEEEGAGGMQPAGGEEQRLEAA